MQKSGKLELTWVGKYEQKEIEPRILVENPELSYGDQDTGNMLIHGDNLIALKALEQDYAGKIKCVYLDPPYNIDAANEHYDDYIENSVWLSLMQKRLEIIANLLADDGVILVQIDKEQSAYLKVLMDEVFTRQAYVTTIAVRMSATSGFKIEHADKTIVKNVEYIHVYSKNLKIKPAYETVEYDAHYNYILKPISDDKWVLSGLLKEEKVVELFKQYNMKPSAKGLTTLFTISDAFKNYVYEHRDVIGRTHTAPAGANKEKEILNSLLSNNNEVVKRNYGEEYYIKKTDTGFNQFIPISLKYNMVDSTESYSLQHSNILGDWWDGFYLDMGNVDNEGSVYFKNSKKPERLLFRILNMFTEPGEIVLDSFLGSGTTAAVAHKMNRVWIGIEMGEHAYSLCKPRIDEIINGQDKTGVTSFVNWQGGGGYKFYELAPSLLVPNPKLPTIKQINPEYTFEMMCEAICKLEGFKYKPDGKFHGKSSEQRFIHITKEFVNGEYVNSLLANLGEGQSLLVYGMKIQSGLRLPDNIIVKKIPKDLLDKCTFESEVK